MSLDNDSDFDNVYVDDNASVDSTNGGDTISQRRWNLFGKWFSDAPENGEGYIQNSTSQNYLDELFDEQFSTPSEKEMENGYDSDNDNFKHLRKHVNKKDLILKKSTLMYVGKYLKRNSTNTLSLILEQNVEH